MKESISNFIRSMVGGRVGEYVMCKGGCVTLYSSCFAAMTLHYVDSLPTDSSVIVKWIDYINEWQDPVSGYFIGPELIGESFEGNLHDAEHLQMHLTCQVLPALALLGGRPKYSLAAAKKFLDIGHLEEWLGRRDWKKAWLEGNNLLFIGQLLIFLRDVEAVPSAQFALDRYFKWLDEELDPNTNLWGTNGHCSTFEGMCGGYHQLLCYYYEGRPIPYPDKLIDAVLPLQHYDGGFAPWGGGGACEDVDAVDILVNMYKRTTHRRAEVRIALRRVLSSILRKQMSDGGFVYRLNEELTHMGIPKTRSPANVSNMFATWFRVHTIALIGEVLKDSEFGRVPWQFNNSCSMGWHKSWESPYRLSLSDRMAEFKKQSAKEFLRCAISPRSEDRLRAAKSRIDRVFGRS